MQKTGGLWGAHSRAGSSRGPGGQISQEDPGIPHFIKAKV